MSPAAGPAPTRSEAKIALLNVDESTSSVLSGCFRQFGIETVVVEESDLASTAGSLSACVVPLNQEAEPLLKAIRGASHRTVIYGVAASVGEALKYSAYGINALFQTPVRNQDAMQVVRATHLLVLKELRRYVRVPLVCSVTLETGTQQLDASSIEVSAGGMSLITRGHLVVPQTILIRFELPGMGIVETRAVVCWTRQQEGTAAIRFDPTDARRVLVQQWIDDYLET